MPINDLARESNIKDSIKKFLVDNIFSSSGIEISFDKGLAAPVIQGTRDTLKWVSVQWGNMDIGTVCSFSLRVYCCSKMDREGFKLSQLRDTVMGYLTDPTKNDGLRRISLYKSNDRPWTVIGSFIIFIDGETGQLELDDETKCKAIDVTLKWGAII